MTGLDRSAYWLAVLLSAQAGFVDALGFIELGGFFVSFMSGNSTRLAVGLAGESRDALTAGLLILTFVAGVFTATLVRAAVTPFCRKPAALAFLALCLCVSAMASGWGAPQAALFGMTFAMGAENLVFEREGEIAIGLTYMTGALVKLGQRLAYAVTGDGAGWAWMPFLGLWAGLVAGAVAGAVVHPHFGLSALWGGAALSSLLAVWRWRHVPAAPADQAASDNSVRR